MPTDSARHIHLMKGLQPEPLASYLSALGALRLLSEQVDPTASGHWQNNHFVIESALDREQLLHFFLDSYEPTPLVSPWNGGSGFYGNDNKDGIDPLSSTDIPRFQPYRHTLHTVKKLLKKRGITDKPADESAKTALLTELRAVLDDRSLMWLDAALVLGDMDSAGKTKVRYAPLLGTGGNDGRLEFSNNFMKRLEEMFLSKKAKPKENRELLTSALYGEVGRFLKNNPVGQFDPGSAGGVNLSVGYEGGALLNPWYYLLMIEGSLILAAAAVGRFKSPGRGGFAFPFTVSHLGSGDGKLAPDEGNRHEIWLPLWERPARLPELANLFSEGRAQNGRQQAKNPIEFSLALASHGISRGLSGFSRYGFLQRNGKSFFATPLGYHAVGERDGSGLIRELEKNWFSSYRHVLKGGAQAAQTALRRYDSAVLDYLKTGQRQGLTTIFERLGDLHQYLCSSPKAREMIRALPEILTSPEAPWLELLDDGTPEFRLALSLATLGQGQWEPELNVRAQLGPYDAQQRRWASNDNNFRARWVGRDLPERMISLLKHRLHAVEKLGRRDQSQQTNAWRSPLWGATSAKLADIERFIEGDIQEARLERLFYGLSLIRPAPYRPQAPYEATFVSLIYAVPKLALHQGMIQREEELTDPSADGQPIDERRRDRRLPPPTILAQLAAGHIQRTLQASRRFLLGRRITVPAAYSQQVPHLGLQQSRRMAAALLFPIDDWTYRQLARQALHITDDPQISKETQTIKESENQHV